MSDTIGQLLGLKPVKVLNLKHPKVNCADPALVYGVELEIEDCNPDWATSGFTAKEDGSLRNNGWEFVSSPMDYHNLSVCLDKFYSNNEPGDNNYSDRCSIHVHANCIDLTKEQLAAVLLQYQAFEDLLYAFVGQDRDKNIFCIPWSETQLTYNFVSKIEKEVAHIRNWQKYTGLNLLPLRTLGTIEFRQMGGHHDVEKIKLWLNLIGAMFAFTRANSLADVKRSIMEVNTTSAYSGLLDRVFKDYANSLKSPGYEQILENGILNVKYMLLDEGRNKKPKAVPEEPDWLHNFEELAIRAQNRPGVQWPVNRNQEGLVAQVVAAQQRLERAEEAEFFQRVRNNIQNNRIRPAGPRAAVRGAIGAARPQQDPNAINWVDDVVPEADPDVPPVQF